MITAKCSNSLRAILLDTGMPTNTIVGYAMLMAAGVQSVAISAINATTNVFTSTINLPVGSKVRLSAGVGGVLPSPVIGSVDYFVIPSTSTTLSLALSKADAIAGIAIDLTDAGTLPINCNEQPLDESSPIEQLVSHELNPSLITGYGRRSVSFGAAVVVGSNVQKPPLAISWITGNEPFDYLAWVVIWGGAITIGNSTGDGVIFGSDGTTYQIPANDSGGITIRAAQVA